MPRTKCPTVRSGGTTSVRSALMPMVMTSRASMEWSDLAFWRAKQQRRHSGARGARARNPYSRSWLWIPRCAIAHLRPAPSGASRNDERNLLLRSSRAFNEGLAALHLVGQRRFVDLDHDVVGIDAEVLYQSLRDVAHHAGLLFVGAAGGHAHGNFRHYCLLFLFSFRHGRACPGHPRSSLSIKTWMPGTRPGMTAWIAMSTSPHAAPALRAPWRPSHPPGTKTAPDGSRAIPGWRQSRRPPWRPRSDP